MLTSLVLFAVFLAAPCEYHIDYGAAPVPVDYVLTISLVAGDGKRLNLPIEWTANTNTRDVRLD